MNNESVTKSTQSSQVEPTRTGRVYTPDVDITENSESIVLMADMAGVSAEGLNVSLENNVLTIEGSATLPALGKHRLAHAEFGTGEFRRAFTISNEIDRNAITASVKNGVLRLELPKATEARVRSIKVEAA
jgi:HSP20 family protein